MFISKARLEQGNRIKIRKELLPSRDYDCSQQTQTFKHNPIQRSYPNNTMKEIPHIYINVLIIFAILVSFDYFFLKNKQEVRLWS